MAFLVLVITNLETSVNPEKCWRWSICPAVINIQPRLASFHKNKQVYCPSRWYQPFPPKLHLVTVFHHSKSNPDWYRNASTIYHFLLPQLWILSGQAWKAVMLGNFSFFRKIIYLGTCFQPQRDIMVGSRQGWHSWESYILIYGQQAVRKREGLSMSFQTLKACS